MSIEPGWRTSERHGQVTWIFDTEAFCATVYLSPGDSDYHAQIWCLLSCNMIDSHDDSDLERLKAWAVEHIAGECLACALWSRQI